MNEHRYGRLAIVAIVLATCTLVPTSWYAAFHCDELVAMRHAGDFGRGDFGNPGRPGLLWLILAPLTWLEPALGMRLGRLVALLASLLTLCGVWVVAERRAEGDESTEGAGWRGVAALGLLVTSISWQSHAFELRTDTFVTALCFPIALLMWRNRPGWRRMVTAGLMLGAIGLISQKSLYNGVALGAAWLVWVALIGRPLEPGRRIRLGLLAAGAAVLLVLAWYALMIGISGEGSDFASKNLTTAVNTGFNTTTKLASKVKYTRLSAFRGLGVWALFVPGVVAAAIGFRRRPHLAAMSVVALVMLGTITVHRGFWRYYIASFEPFMAVVSGALLGSACSWLHRRLHLAVGLLLLVAVLGGLAGLGAKSWRPMVQVDNQLQLQLMHDAREAFPEPVPYWDSVGIISGYPETTFFGTGKTRQGARALRGERMYVDMARERRPRFFVRDYMTRDKYMGKSERRWIWRQYLPYRPNLYLHGGRMRVTDELATQEVEILVEGIYTVWLYGGWQGEAFVDGARVQHEQEIELETGSHRLAARTDSRLPAQLWLLLGAGRVPGTDRVDHHRDYSMYPPLLRNRYQRYDRGKSSRADLLSPPWSPGLTDEEFESRVRRHGRMQSRRDEKLGVP
jgi:hypothetical protein